VKYEPRELTTEQKNFRVDLVTGGGGAYGYGETLDEAEKNAKHFFKRTYGRSRVSARIVQRWTVSHWEEVSEGWHEVKL